MYSGVRRRKSRRKNFCEDEQRKYQQEKGYRVAPALYNFDAAAYESIMLGMFQLYSGPENDVLENTGMPKITHLEFAYSRDGFHYSRPDRTPAIRAEGWDSDAWDKGYIQPLGNIYTLHDDKIYFYYCGFSGNPQKTRHTMEQNKTWHYFGDYDNSATGLAILRRDGFASLEPENGDAGSVLTKPLLFSGSRLYINFDAPEGNIICEITDKNGTVIPGYEAASCHAVSGDSTRMQITWDKTDTIKEAAGISFRFRFLLNRAKLYAFWVEKNE